MVYALGSAIEKMDENDGYGELCRDYYRDHAGPWRPSL